MRVKRDSDVSDHFRVIANSAPVLLWMSREDSMCIFFNDIWLKFTGRTLEQEWGVGWAEGVYFEDLQQCLDTYIDAFNARQPFEMEYRLRGADGKYRWILDRAAPHYREDGTFSGYLGSCVDISDRKYIEQSHAEGEARLKAIIDSVFSAIIIIDPLGTIEQTNPAVEKLFGYTREECIGLKIDKLIQVPTLPYIVQGKLLLGTRKDGSMFTAEINVSKCHTGNKLNYVCVIRDVSEREKSRQQVADSQQQLQAIIDSAVDAIITIDKHGVIQQANPAVETIFGYTERDLIGQNVCILMTSPDRERHAEYLRHYEQTGERKIIGIGREVLARRKNGSIFAAELAVNEFFIHGQKRYTGIIRDVSERKKILEQQSEFVSTVSHELRTPLTSIRGSLGLIAGGVTGELNDDLKEHIGIALSNADRLVRLINDILDIEKIQSGRMEFRMKLIDLDEAVRSSIDSNRSFASMHNVRIKLLSTPERREVVADEDRLAQVLTNLISNAAKFSPPNARVSIWLETKNNHFRVNVRDKGSGVPEEFRERLFERFTQADASMSRSKGGTGLGLAISKAIVEKMRGHIGYEALEDGSNFFFDLPRVPRIPETIQTNRQRVLICEDDPDYYEMIRQIADTLGYESEIAPTIERARDLLFTRNYDLAVLDVLLADGDGTVLLKEPSVLSSKRIPVLIVSVLEKSNIRDRMSEWSKDVTIVEKNMGLVQVHEHIRDFFQQHVRLFFNN